MQTSALPRAVPPASNPPTHPLFAKQRRIHPKSVRGRFRRLKWLVLALVVAVYHLLPWLRWDRGPGLPDQAVLFDLENQRFYLFAVELWPQQVYYITGAMILAAVGLFLATALAGRVWCGFACPHTLWTDLFVLVERLVEGDRGARIRLDQAPRTPAWIARKTVKHGLWLLLSLAAAVAGVLYFTDAPTLAADTVQGEVPMPAVWSVLFFTGATYLMAGFAREQMCFYVCPWPRIQASMLDEDSLTVTYQAWRGEGRAPLRKEQGWDGRTAQGLGDCIDCNACVHVCPTGIDIRDGDQMECIGCGLCVDACNEVMVRVGRPGELIRFDTQVGQAARAAGLVPPRRRVIRPRTLVYGLILSTVTALMAAGLWLRPALDVAVLRDRAPLFVIRADGGIQNAYTIKIANMTATGRRYRLGVTGVAGTVLALAGGAEGDTLELAAAADAVATHRLYVRAPAQAAPSVPLTVVLTAMDGETVRRETVFLSPR